MDLQLAVLPGLCTLGFGVLAGVAISISAIRAALQKYRSQMIWRILGLMLGSLYAIANGILDSARTNGETILRSFFANAYDLDQYELIFI